MKSLRGYVKLRDVLFEAGYRAVLEHRVVSQFCAKVGVEVVQRSFPRCRTVYCVQAGDAEPLAALLRERRTANLDPEQKAKVMAQARAVRASNWHARGVRTKARARVGPEPESTRQKPPEPPVLQSRPMLAPREPVGFKSSQQELEIVVRKLIHLCKLLSIDSITVQDGKAEIIRSVTVTKEETIKG